MRRLAHTFDSAGPLLNVLYWLSLWWVGQIAAGLGAFAFLGRAQEEGWWLFLGLAPESTSLARSLVIGAHAAAFLWLGGVGWAARRIELRLASLPGDAEARLMREGAERRGVRWMLGIAVSAAWLVPGGTAVGLAVL